MEQMYLVFFIPVKVKYSGQRKLIKLSKKLLMSPSQAYQQDEYSLLMAMMLPFKRLKELLALINLHLPHVSSVSSYCLPRNLGNKTVEQLAELRSLGLKLMHR